MVSMQAYEESQHELDILRLLARGEKEIEAGAGYELGGVLKEVDRFLKIVEETRGAWADKRHPDLRSSRDVEAYLGKHRDSLQGPQGFRSKQRSGFPSR